MLYRKIFFFSSRRRHTRYIGDWSSDVCSSDLAWSTQTYSGNGPDFMPNEPPTWPVNMRRRLGSTLRRSEERRVGKEWKCGWMEDLETGEMAGGGGWRVRLELKPGGAGVSVHRS